MQIGMIGLGRMGSNMARRLMRAGHGCVAYDRNQAAVGQLGNEGAAPAESLDDLVDKLEPPRVVWMMVPAGEPTEQTAKAMAQKLKRGDVLIDGGNSFYKDSVRRGKLCAEQGVRYLDVGTSGGVWGLERGYCLMIGGEKEAFQFVEPILKTLAPGSGEIERTPGRTGDFSAAEQGYLYCGPSGAGHYVKMVHNGIEYGVMQAYAEGFDLLSNASEESRPESMRYDLPLREVAEVWRRGSVIGSWLLDLSAAALFEDDSLSGYEGFVHDSGEGRWTLKAAVEDGVPAGVLATALFARFRSRETHTFGEKLLSAMRDEFGGHKERHSK